MTFCRLKATIETIVQCHHSQRFVPSIDNIAKTMRVFNCLGRPGHFGQYILKTLQFCSNTLLLRVFFHVFMGKYTVLHMFTQVLFWAGNQGNHQDFDSFLLTKKLLASFPCKSVKVSWLARMGQNFDDFPGFQPKTTPL